MWCGNDYRRMDISDSITIRVWNSSNILLQKRLHAEINDNLD